MSELGKELFRSGFVSGMTTYQDHYPGHEQDHRIVIPVSIAGKFSTQMMVDTGGEWCVLDPEIIEYLWDEVLSSYDSDKDLRIRGQPYKGKIVRLPITIPAVEGEGIEIIAMIFVPILPAGAEWGLPNFIGMTGFLDRIRFAVDPDSRRYAFYFGHVD